MIPMRCMISPIATYANQEMQAHHPRNPPSIRLRTRKQRTRVTVAPIKELIPWQDTWAEKGFWLLGRTRKKEGKLVPWMT